jgi:hypothetical protein
MAKQYHIPDFISGAKILRNHYVFGDAGGYFDGTSGYLSTPDHSDWDIFATTTEDWTMDCWVKLEDDTTEYLVTQWSAATTFWRWYKTSAPQGLFFTLTVGGSNLIVLDSKTAMGDNTWHHVVFLKRGTEYALYVDGIQKAYDTSASTANFTNPLQIGAINGGGFLTGYMDDLRIIQSNAFSTYPVPEPYLHYRLNDDAASTTVIDTGSGGNNGTAIGGNTDTLSTVGKIGKAFDFAGSDAVNFNSAIASIASDTAGTISFWAKPDVVTGSATLFILQDAAGLEYIRIARSGSTFRALIEDPPNSANHLSGGTFTAGVWNHWVVTQDGSTGVKIYKDGVDQSSSPTLGGSWTGVEWVNNLGTGATIGRVACIDQGGNTNFFDGQMDDVRYYSGVALTSNQVAELYHGGRGTEEVFAGKLTVPTSAHTPDGDTRLLLDFDGNIKDESNHEVTAVNTPTIDTGTKQWGAGSALFDGISDYLELPDSPDWDIFGTTTETWTCEAWVRETSAATTKTILAQIQDVNNSWLFRISSGTLGLFLSTGGSARINLNAGSVPSDTWTHVAFIKSGTDYGLFVDGVQTGYDTDSFTLSASATPLWIGRGATPPGQYFDGYIDDLKITKGSPYDIVPSKTALLLDGEGTDEDTSTTDDSHYGHTVSMNSGCKLDNGAPTGQKFNATTSIFFDGTNDDISIPDSSAWDVMANAKQDVTIDMWVNLAALPTDTTLISQREDASNRWELIFSGVAGLRFFMVSNGTTVVDTGSNGAPSLNTWAHVAMCKVGGSGCDAEYGVYIDGVQVGYDIDPDTDTFAAGLTIGSRNSTNYFSGYMEQIRITYTNLFNAAPDPDGVSDTITVPTGAITLPNSFVGETFTVPTAAHTTDDDTKLLLPFDTDFKDTSNHDRQIMTPTAPAGAAARFGDSFEFNGSSDKLTVPDSPDFDIFETNTDDWTVDFWARHKSVGTNQYYVTQRVDDANRWQIQNVAGGVQFAFTDGGTDYINVNASGFAQDLDWHHIAVIKVGNEYGIYIDGVQGQYATTNNTRTYAANLAIGSSESGTGHWFNGFMDELRIQNSNYFSAAPNICLTNTITVPTEAYSLPEELLTRAQAVIVA